jgi:hypothetical protein
MAQVKHTTADQSKLAEVDLAYCCFEVFTLMVKAHKTTLYKEHLHPVYQKATVVHYFSYLEYQVPFLFIFQPFSILL